MGLAICSHGGSPPVVVGERVEDWVEFPELPLIGLALFLGGWRLVDVVRLAGTLVRP